MRLTALRKAQTASSGSRTAGASVQLGEPISVVAPTGSVHKEGLLQWHCSVSNPESGTAVSGLMKSANFPRDAQTVRRQGRFFGNFGVAKKFVPSTHSGSPSRIYRLTFCFRSG